MQILRRRLPKGVSARGAAMTRILLLSSALGCCFHSCLNEFMSKAKKPVFCNASLFIQGYSSGRFLAPYGAIWYRSALFGTSRMAGLKVVEHNSFTLR